MIEQGGRVYAEVESNKADKEQWTNVLLCQRKKALCDETATKRSENLLVSPFQGLTLKQYRSALKNFCQKEHKDCVKCGTFIIAAETVLSRLFIPLSELWRICNPKANRYDSGKAQEC